MSRRPTTVTAQKIQLEYLRTRIEDVAYFSLCLLNHVLQLSGPPAPRQLDHLRQWVRTNQTTKSDMFKMFKEHFSNAHPSFVAEIDLASQTLSACTGVLMKDTPRDPVGNLWLFLLRFVDERPHLFQETLYQAGLLPEVREHMSKFLFVLNQPVRLEDSPARRPVAVSESKPAVISSCEGPGYPEPTGWGGSLGFHSTVGATHTK